MPLHPYLKDHELPKCLTKPLEWGNREQIEALCLLESKIQAKEDEANGVIKKFKVYIEVSGYEEIEIKAISEKEAIEKAQDGCDADSLDLETSYGIVRG